jgi:uncharacterized protein Yka (UPF0111/DUF47 family)
MAGDYDDVVRALRKIKEAANRIRDARLTGHALEEYLDIILHAVRDLERRADDLERARKRERSRAEEAQRTEKS